MKPISDTTPQAAVDPHISRSIDIIRGAAALGVIWGHSMYGLSLPVELNGAFWVWIFLPISGYLVGLIKSLEWCGFHCYGIYVWHAVLAIINHQLWKIPVGSPLLVLLLLAVPIAPLSYKLIEKPMLRFKMTHR